MGICVEEDSQINENQAKRYNIVFWVYVCTYVLMKGSFIIKLSLFYCVILLWTYESWMNDR